MSRPRVQTNTPNYTFSSFCLHPTLTGLKCLIYNTLISVGNTAIHLHYHLHTHLCTTILHCDSRAGNGIGGADFLLLQSSGRSPYAVKRGWHNHFHPCLHHLHYNCGSADKCKHQCTLKVQLPTLPKRLIINAVQTLCARCKQKGAKHLTRARASICYHTSAHRLGTLAELASKLTRYPKFRQRKFLTPL